MTNITSRSSGSVYFNISFRDSDAGYYIFVFYNGSAWINDSSITYTSAAVISILKNVTFTNGYINWTWFVNDSLGNKNQTTQWTVLINNSDLDNDGVVDGNDPLLYNESNVTTSGITHWDITVGGGRTNEAYSDVQEMRFYDANTLLINFSHNFSITNFDLRNVTIVLSSLHLS